MAKTALIIDDSALSRLTLKRYLEKFGVSIMEADGVVDSRRYFSLPREKLPDMVFMDIFMPDLDGFDGIREILDNENTKHLPVIMYSGDCSPETKRKAREAGAKGFLRKPVSETHLRILLLRLDSMLDTRPDQTAALPPSEEVYLDETGDAAIDGSDGMQDINLDQDDLLIPAASTTALSAEERPTSAPAVVPSVDTRQMPMPEALDMEPIRQQLERLRACIIHQDEQLEISKHLQQRQLNDINYLSAQVTAQGQKIKAVLIIASLLAVLSILDVVLMFYLK